MIVRNSSSDPSHKAIDIIIMQFGAAVTTTEDRRKKKLDPNAQRLLLELATVNEIQKKIDYANAFVLRSFSLKRLEMEQQQGEGEQG